MGKSLSESTFKTVQRNLKIEKKLLEFYKYGGNFKGKYIYYIPDKSVNSWVVSDTNIMKEEKEKTKTFFIGSLYQCFKFIGYDREEAERILKEIESKYL
jgi:hypothetical protein